ncbi:MAG: GNAT family N-acetyltransferase [Eubacterium sp.]|nr:GNAT family N-acetyltransferase [Eubacterium sp.]
MKVISYFDSDRQSHWLNEIKKGDWGAAGFLYELLSKGTFHDTVGERSKVLLLTDSDNLVSFCTYAEKDDIQPTDLTPWMGFVYTFPEYRGHHYVGLLLEEIERLAREDGVSEVYISTNHIGLYEKYGCEFKEEMKDMEGELSRVYVKKIHAAPV